MSATAEHRPVRLLDELASTLTGELVRPGDEAYDEARSVWNGMIDLRPVAVARCASTHDVAAAIRVARESGVPLAVRGGGHNVAGFGTIDRGLVDRPLPDERRHRGRDDPARPRRRRRHPQAPRRRDAGARSRRPGRRRQRDRHRRADAQRRPRLGAAQVGLSCDNLVGVELVTAAGTVLSRSRAGAIPS